MSRPRYSEHFKQQAVSQVTDAGRPVAEVSKELGVSDSSLYQWLKRSAKPAASRQRQHLLATENRRLKLELKRLAEERDILKKAQAYFARQSG
ncbi:transposase [Halomonas litopenaei]|uniref:transposase n=1 Tax=Halomonas litopenaei TaxID=2109328 RepID=UPI003FA039D9